MGKWNVYMQTWASTCIKVDIEDEEDEDATKEAAIDAAYAKGGPTLCGRCSGYSNDGGSPLELNDTWEVSEFQGESMAERVE